MSEASELEPFRRFLNDKKLGFPTFPQVASDLQTFAMPDGLGVQIRGLPKPILLRGRLVESVIPWLMASCDGRKSLQDLLASRPAGCSPKDLADALMLLYRKGVLGDKQESAAAGTADETTRRQELFWGRQLGVTRNNNEAAEIAAKIKQARILFIGNGLYGTVAYDLLRRSGFTDVVVLEWGPDAFMSESIASSASTPLQLVKLGPSLDESRLRLLELLPLNDLVVLAMRNCASNFFEQLNLLCLSHERRWLYSHDRSSAIDIGPFIDPHSSACWTCMHLRQVTAIEDAMSEAIYDQEISNNPPQQKLLGESLTLATLAASILLEETIRIVTVVNPPALFDCMISVDSAGNLKKNRIRRVPRCPDCYRGKHERILSDSESLTGV